MDLSPYVDNLSRELSAAAATGGEDARAVAERLTAALESAARLALLEALSAAAGEITRELAPGSVDVRLRGRDPDFIVTPPPSGQPADEPAPAGTAPPAPSLPLDTEQGGTSRISLRLPEHLKPRIEEAASREGLSVNAWLVRAVAAALEPADRTRAGRPPASPGGRSFTGWAR